MKILIANQKGGVGKTSLAILLANYLKYKKGMRVMGLDFDFQASFYNQWETDLKVIGSDDPYKVGKASLANARTTLGNMDSYPETIFILDSPGKTDDKQVLELFTNIDLLICPFTYERKTFRSTYAFTKIVKHVNPDVRMLFVPNRIKTVAKYKLRERVREALGTFGDVYQHDISERVCMERINFFATTREQAEITEGFFDYIISQYALNK
ncbi:MAG: ParA family protein [Bacteroidota bacterium]